MPAYRDIRNGAWRYRKQIRLPDGRSKRIEGTPNKNTKEAAETAEREHINRLEEAVRHPQEPPKEVPKFEEFAEEVLGDLRATRTSPARWRRRSQFFAFT